MSDNFVPYIGHHTKKDIDEMLSVIGVKDAFELFSDVPRKFILPDPPELEGPRTEQEVREEIRRILAKNRKALRLFIGGGVWPHYIPAAVKEVSSRSEFLTSYTPYQPEVSQGILTALFEFQSLVADLYAVDVVNSSMYDWGTAVGEAFRMAYRYNGRKKVVVASHTGPDRIRIAQTYIKPLDMKLEKVPFHPDATVDEEKLKQITDNETAAVYVENPCYLGAIVSNVKAVGEIAHDYGALFIVGAEPTSLGLFTPPGEYGADIVVGEGQPLGMPMNFGGPLLGILGCRSDRRLLHAMPGRIVGMTETLTDRRRAFTMILRAREQDIKREKATSNICTNQAFCAVIAAAYLTLLGKNGLRQLSRHIFDKTAYFAQQLSRVDHVVSPVLDAPHYMEFTYRVEGLSADALLKKLLDKGFVGGIAVGKDFPSIGDAVLTCVTEVHSVEDIDEYVKTVEEAV
ncbi:MAG: aminomethyl-transferring glycine dehydrogenase subunit GcvPA [Candidatus Caldarchaeum sp.]|nr:aminomethyl-transferring glycine dehydrogenase subunit GcvPA [Candidatus Caldarchaeum sp.]